MTRKEFSKEVVELVLIKCRRHCAVCDHWCGVNIEIHHIDDSDDNSQDNALPVCFECHATIGHYNPKHPKGKKYTSTELRKLRDICFERYDDTLPSLPKGKSDYGRGFHDGVEWTEKKILLKDLWRYLSAHGDYAIENLLYFETEDTHTMMDETFLADNVITSYGTQYKNHYSAWSTGMSMGLWGLDGNSELLYITEKGKKFRELIKSNESLRERYSVLKDFWNNHSYDKELKRPGEHSKGKNKKFRPGILNALQTEIYKTVRINNDKSNLFLINNVTPDSIELINIESGDITTLKEEDILEDQLDHSTGEIILFLN
jgi:hypothetical protein